MRLKVSLVIPTRNEEGSIGLLLDEIPRKCVDEVIIVDGNSSDKTVEVAKKHIKPRKDKILKQKGMGYGGALKQGADSASGDVIIMMDADGSHNPADIPFMLNKVEEGYEYVMASRYAVGGRSYDDTIVRWFGNMVFTKMTNIVHNMRVTDSLYLFTAMKREAYKKLDLETTGFEFCTEIIVKAAKAQLRFAEVPAIERARYAGESKVFAPWHGLKILLTIFRKY
jgi:glycosyltransferase involved in cell wall biosynthesis